MTAVVEQLHLRGQHDQQSHAGGRGGRDPLAPGTGVYQDDYGTLEIRSTGVDRIRQAVYDYLGGEDVFDIVVVENSDGTRSVDVENLYGSEGTIEGEQALEAYLNEGGIDDINWDGDRGSLHASYRGAIDDDPVMKEFSSRVETTFSGAFETPDGEAFQIGETRFAFMEANGETAARAEINGSILNAEGEPVGTFSRAVYDDGVVYNHSLNIYPEFQGQGIGTAFLDRTEAGPDVKEIRMSAVAVGKYAWAARGYRLDHRSNSTIVADTRDRWIFEARNVLADTPEWRAGDYTTIDRLAALEREWQNDITSIYPADLLAIDPSLKSVLLNGPSWDAVRELNGGLAAAAGVMVFHVDHDQSTHGNWATGGGSKVANVKTVDEVESIVDGMYESLQARYKAMEDTAIGPVASAKWRASRGMKLTDAEQYTIDLMNGEPDAVAEYKQAMRDRVAEYPTADAETVAAVEAGAAYEADNPRFGSMIERYGEIPVMPVADADGADARYIQNAIIIGETTSHVPSADITRDAFTIDRSMSGTIRHEYGHHVQTRLTKEQDERWSEVVTQWGSMSAGPDDLFKMYSDGSDGAGLSLYARMNSDETFAEAFSLVTHRDFDPGADYGPAQPIVDFMREIVE